MVNIKEDLTGKVFGKLKVICQTEDHVTKSGRHYARWLCECSCEEHKRIKVIGNSLTSGQTKSCGCLKAEHLLNMQQGNKKQNKYRFEEDVVYGKCFNDNIEFCFSIEDFDMLSKFCWCVDNSNGYIVARDSATNKKIYMHKLVCITDGQVDHINRKRFDNRRSNLRPTSQQKNRFNNSLRPDNTTGVMGVSWHSQSSKWLAQIQVDNKHFYLGVYDNFDDAVVARLNAELKYFGTEFASQRHLFEQYGITIQNDLEVVE